jgi:catechol 2,3-dioxygenase-like lactoylglutathione lyase family enzyme
VSTFQGVDHVGVGVGDVDAAIEFYGRHVGFDSVLFDYTGELPGLEAVAGRRPRARVAMVENSGATLVYLSAGATWNISRRFSAYAFMQAPVYQRVNGLQLEATQLASIGLHYHF